MSTFTHGFLIPLFLVTISFGLIMVQPDFGAVVVLVDTCVLMMFIAGAWKIYFVYLAIVGFLGLAYLIISSLYRFSPFAFYLNEWEVPLGDGFRVIIF